jgi:hypothetical protein
LCVKKASSCTALHCLNDSAGYGFQLCLHGFALHSSFLAHPRLLHANCVLVPALCDVCTSLKMLLVEKQYDFSSYTKLVRLHCADKCSFWRHTFLCRSTLQKLHLLEGLHSCCQMSEDNYTWADTARGVSTSRVRRISALRAGLHFMTFALNLPECCC